MRFLTFACVAATAAALVASPLRSPICRVQRRTRKLVAQYGGYSQYDSSQQHGYGTPLPHGWEMYQDEQGQIYYGNAQTGQTQWEPPTQQGYAQQDYAQQSFEQSGEDEQDHLSGTYCAG